MQKVLIVDTSGRTIFKGQVDLSEITNREIDSESECAIGILRVENIRVRVWNMSGVWQGCI